VPGPAAPLPIPPALWTRVLAFLAAGATGQIRLSVTDGVVTRMEVVEVVGVKRERP
jgi:hypothetical protein